LGWIRGWSLEALDSATRVAAQRSWSGTEFGLRYAGRRFVEACHTADLHVFGFGLGDDPTRTVEIRAMRANGTDFVSSGKPDLLRAFVDGCAPRTFDV
jgi:hypothetical protein